MEKRVVLFDFDGPIVDSALADAKAGSKNSIDIHVPVDKMLPCMIRNHLSAPSIGLDQDQVNSRSKNLLGYNKQMVEFGASVRISALDAIKELRATNMIGIVSNGHSWYLDTLLSSHLINQESETLFELGLWGYDTFHYLKLEKILEICRLYKIKITDVRYVTDTVNDYLGLCSTDAIQPSQIYPVTYGGIHNTEIWNEFNTKQGSPIPKENFIHSPEDLVLLK
jgi:phosphoglycolate phosphatase-like HAD superfamily hydrolase